VKQLVAASLLQNLDTQLGLAVTDGVGWCPAASELGSSPGKAAPASRVWADVAYVARDVCAKTVMIGALKKNFFGR
jgi:hypothetical protein